jgi:hypothetical protein
MRVVLSVALALALLPAAASAVTVPEIVSLTKAGVSEQVILALIERDKNIFTIAPEQLVTLQKEGVTDAVLVAMLRSGREEPLPQQPAVPPSAYPTAQYYQPEPNVVVVGHGPDRPNTGDGYYGAASYIVPYVVPVPYPVLVRGQRTHRGVRDREVPIREFAVPLTPPGLLAPNSSLQSRPQVTAPPATGIFFTAPARGIFFER